MGKRYYHFWRNYGNFDPETTIIEKFEYWEELTGKDYGKCWKDFGPSFLLFRVGFLDGGNS